VSASARRGLSRVVVTGMGIVSCLGNTLDGVSSSLRVGRSGITRVEAWRERGFASQVAGVASVDQETPFDRRVERFMGDTARFACHAARKAVDDAGLDLRALRSPRAGAVIGSGVGALSAYDAALATAHARGVDKVPPYAVPQTMSSTASASVAQFFGIEGTCYSPSSACTTSALAIGQAMQLIQTGRQDIVLAGGSEALHDNTTLMFDAMGALSRRFNETPRVASRPYDTQRDGFVIASGGGVLVLEALDHALARGARIYAELTGFGHCTDGAGMIAPRAPGIARAMRAALEEAGGAHPDYVNVHAPSTVPGDSEEARAMTEVFGERMPPFSSTKRFTGHPLGACGVHEAIYALLMMRDGFMAGMGEIETPDPCISGLPVVTATRAAHVGRAMSISFGFGGSCASLMFDAWNPADAGRTF
jgi:3-oxoacyl-[acyl-carrier-protein] synthase I